MRFLIILILSLIALSSNAQIIKSNAIMELNNMDFSTPCTSCSEWRYSRNTNFLYRWNGTGWIIYNPGSTLNLGLSMPGIFNVSPSTLTGSGTFNVTLNSQAQNTFLAAPSNASGVPSFRTLTPSDLSVAGGLSGTSSAGRVAFYTGTSTLTGDANLTWDNSDKSLSLGGSGVSSSLLTLNSTTRGILIPRMTTTEKNAIVAPATGLLVYDLTLGAFNVYNGSAWVSVGGGLPAGANGEVQFNNNGVFGASSNLFWDNANSRLGLRVTTPASPLEINNNGIGQTPDINSGLVLSNYTVSASGNQQSAPSITFKGRAWQANPGVDVERNFVIRHTLDGTTNGGFNALDFIGSGINYMRLSTVGGATFGQGITVNTISTTTSGTALTVNTGASSSTGVSFTGFADNTTSGEKSTISSGKSFVPTSGNAVRNELLLFPTINQTGGANGITRGLYIAPTLTSAADWRSIQFDNNTGWGLYGNGTANNYLAGNLTIGNPVVAARLSVRGSGSDNNASSLLIQNSLARTLFSVRNDGLAQLGRNTAVTTQEVAQIQVVSDDTNTGLVLTPKGTGAFILGPAPDGTAVGGNARGANAIDLQSVRTHASRVASGQESVISGGRENTASATGSFVGGGLQNTASATNSAVLGGQSNIASGTHSVVAGGQQNSASAGYSAVVGGLGGVANVQYQTVLGSNGAFAFVGDNQTSVLRVRNTVTGNNLTELFVAGSTRYVITPVANTTSRIVNARIQCVATVVTQGAGTAPAGSSFIQTYDVGIKRIGNTTTLIGGAPIATSATGDNAMSGANFIITADDTNEALKVEFQPPSTVGSDTVIRAIATIYLTELGY